MTLKVLLTGAGGLLGRALSLLKPEHVVLQAYTRQQLDITQAHTVNEVVQAFQPDVIINAAAYTQVDLAEQESENAYAVNRDGALYMAQAAAALDIPLLHISTDYVFDGVFTGGVCKPYTEGDMPSPLNVYGVSKLAGEKAVLSTHGQALIVRTSTLFASIMSKDGGDFVAWVLEQALKKKTLTVVDGWVSCPTPVESLAAVLWQLVEKVAQKEQCSSGLWHYAGTPAVSRYAWAKEIVAIAKQKGVLKHDVAVLPCKPDGVVTLAKRPAYSALDCSQLQQAFEIEPSDWQKSLYQCSMNTHADE